MSNNLVDTGENYQDTPVEDQEEEEEKLHGEPSPTLVPFRIRSDAVMFYKRMIKHFCESHLIAEPKLSLLASH